MGYVGAPAGRSLKAHDRHHQVRHVDRPHMMTRAVALRQGDLTVEIAAEQEFKTGDVRPSPGHREHGVPVRCVLAPSADKSRL